jgi:hypothetical protein
LGTNGKINPLQRGGKKTSHERSTHLLAKKKDISNYLEILNKFCD